MTEVAAPARRGHTIRGLSYTGRAVIVIYVEIDSIIFPIFRPTPRWLGGRSFVRSAQRRVARLPPYVILGFLAAALCNSGAGQNICVISDSYGSGPVWIARSCRRLFRQPCHCGAPLPRRPNEASNDTMV
jgi:hypothetical protein